MLKRTLEFLAGLILLPICIASSIGLYEQLNRARFLSYDERYFLFGIVTYLIVHAVFFKPSYPYILGHEIMHALATWLSGGKVRSFKASPRGGKVTTNKSNIFIALAPYFFPFYTIVVVIIFAILRLLMETNLPYAAFFFLVGFTFSFHIILTIDFLKIKQTDFLYGGYFFSVALIYIVNIFIVALMFSFLFDGVNFFEFCRTVYIQTKDTYVAVFRQLFR